MNLSRLGRGEFLAVLGGLLLALGLFLPWYGTNPDNRNANIDGVRGNVSRLGGAPDPALVAARGGGRAADPGLGDRPRSRAVVAAR